MIRTTLAAALVSILAACGGGGDPAEAPAHVTPTPPPTTVTAPTACVPRAQVSVDLRGDSTQFGIDGSTTRPGYFGAQAVHNPGAVLQANMDSIFGPGRVVVTNRGVPGAVAEDDSFSPADVIVENFGANNLVGRDPISQFSAAILALKPTIIETQMPTPYGDTLEADYVNAERALAVGPIALVDVNAYVRSLPNWQSYFPDQQSVHGNDEIYRLIADNAMTPAVAAQVAPLLCVKG